MFDLSSNLKSQQPMKLPSSLSVGKTDQFQTENVKEDAIFSNENFLLTGWR